MPRYLLWTNKFSSKCGREQWNFKSTVTAPRYSHLSLSTNLFAYGYVYVIDFRYRFN